VYLYSFFILSTRWGWVSTPRPGRFTLGKDPVPNCIRGWMGSRAGLDGCEKSRPHRDSIPGPSSAWRVAMPTEPSRPTSRTHTVVHFPSTALSHGTRLDQTDAYTLCDAEYLLHVCSRVYICHEFQWEYIYESVFLYGAYGVW
jgi:hypothetical protein